MCYTARVWGRMILRWTTAAALCLCLVTPFVALLAYPDPESNLPACCRRDGKHHCAMMEQYLARQKAQDGETRVRATGERCPYRSSLTTHRRHQQLAAPAVFSFYSGVESHPTIFVYVEAYARVSKTRSNLKRGPPSPLV